MPSKEFNYDEMRIRGNLMKRNTADDAWMPMLSDPLVAYIRSNGSDATGDGSPMKPYATCQKAVDEGFTVLDRGVGADAGITLGGGDVTLSVRGCGIYRSSIAFIRNPGGTTTVYDIAGNSILLSEINTAPASPSGTTRAGGNQNLYNVVFGNLIADGSSGLSSGDPIADGGAGGVISLYGNFSGANVATSGGAGGGGDGSNPSGSGGAAGQIIFDGPGIVTDAITCLPGSPGSDGGGGTGSDGSPGAIYCRRGCSVPTPSLGVGSLIVTGATVGGHFITAPNLVADGTYTPVTTIEVTGGSITSIT